MTDETKPPDHVPEPVEPVVIPEGVSVGKAGVVCDHCGHAPWNREAKCLICDPVRRAFREGRLP